MEIKLSAGDLHEMILESNFSRAYAIKNAGISEKVIHLDHLIGSGYYKEIRFEDMHIGFGDLNLKNPTQLHFQTDFETVEMHFDLCGESLFRLNGANPHGHEFTFNQHNIIYAPAVKGMINFRPKTTCMLEINLAPSVFEKYLVGSEGIFRNFLKEIHGQNLALLGKHNMPITPAMMQIIRDITTCKREGIYKRLYLESKVIELLLLQLEQFASHDCRVFCSLNRSDVEKMQQAREIILSRVNNPYTLAELSRVVGTNEFTLKKGFKEVFGTTVFGMLNDVKMEDARKMLLQCENSVSEVSNLAGYKNTTHFSAAFKRKFGVTPSQLRLQRYK